LAAGGGLSGEVTPTGLRAGGIFEALGVRVWGKESHSPLGGWLRGVTPPACPGALF
jgi:hypothetical protein